jgi:hypothetical protein
MDRVSEVSIASTERVFFIIQYGLIRKYDINEKECDAKGRAENY